MTPKRNPSLDSAQSSLSSATVASRQTTHSHQSSTTSTTAGSSGNAATNGDPAAWIRAEGSAEAAVSKLLVERQKMTKRSEGLWRLVEKQRAMIVGLNTDLDRIVKDKDRYRRRLKEREQQLQDLQQHRLQPEYEYQQAHDQAERDRDSSTSRPRSPDTTAAAAASPRLASDPVRTHIQHHSRGDSSNSALTATPLQPYFAHSVHSPGGSVQQDPPREVPATRQDWPEALQSSRSLAAATISPTSTHEGRRKAAPAPLDLTKPQSAPSARSAPPAPVSDDSGSEYEKLLEPDRSPVERGRQRSRADDDRQRQAMALREQEAARSQSENSKKVSKSKSKEKPYARGQDSDPSLQSTTIPTSTSHAHAHAHAPPSLPATIVGLPSSPRSNLLGGLQSPLPQVNSNTTSVAAALSSQLDARTAGSRALNTLNRPGLPMSPRPGDRPAGAPVSRAPMTPGPFSPSPHAGFVLSPRAPKGPIPLPPNTPLAVISPHLQRVQQADHQPAQSSLQPERSTQSTLRTSGERSRAAAASDGPTGPTPVYTGFVSDQYPDLLLPPNAIPLIAVRVFSSHLGPSRHSYMASKQSEENPVFTLGVHLRSNQKQLWRVEKSILALPKLDQSLRAIADLQAKIPDRSVFSGHAPAKLDARRAGLNAYFEAVLDTRLDDAAALVVCEFFSTDVIPPELDQSLVSQNKSVTQEVRRRKEGYLTKKGKNFGGWKARFFVLEGQELAYYDFPGGPLVGSIRLRNAQIGKQSAGPLEAEPEDQHRHSLLILEPKRRDSTQKVRHMLCAESDEERDDWVEALLPWTDPPSDDDSSLIDPGSAGSGSFQKSAGDGPISKASRGNSSPLLETISYEDTIPAELPRMGASPMIFDGPQSPSPPRSPRGGPTSIGHPSISSPVAGAFIQNAEAWGNKTTKEKEHKDHKKRGIFGFKSRGSPDVPPTPRDTGLPNENIREQHISGRRSPPRQVFGIPLEEAAEHFPPVGVDICLPSPVYRCIEYLEAHNAAGEEGIFRLSGSTNTIRALRERFNNEGDVRLLDDGQYHDINAVASLLKMYLRELPGSVLHRERHIDFIRVLEIEEKEKKLQAFNMLVHQLPEANFELVSTLSRFLIDIVNNSHVNKMNVRNVGILFSPTLNVPAPLISIFLTDYEAIFAAPLSASDISTISPIIEHLATSTPPSSADDIRSPRKQLFTDLPTPAYNQTAFSNGAYGQDPRAMYDPIYAGRSNTPPYGPPSATTSSTAGSSPTKVLTQVHENSTFGSFGSLNAALAPPSTAPSASPSKTSSKQPSPTSATSTSSQSLMQQQQQQQQQAQQMMLAIPEPTVITTSLPALTDSRPGHGSSHSNGNTTDSAGDEAGNATQNAGSSSPSAAIKKSRRESGILGLSLGHGHGSNSNSSGRKPSMQRLREVVSGGSASRSGSGSGASLSVPLEE